MAWKAYADFLANGGLAEGAIFSLQEWYVFEATDGATITANDMKTLKANFGKYTATGIKLENGDGFMQVGYFDPDSGNASGKLKKKEGSTEMKGIHISKSKDFLVVGISKDPMVMEQGQKVVESLTDDLKSKGF